METRQSGIKTSAIELWKLLINSMIALMISPTNN